MKAFGITFLALPRGEGAERARESSWLMLAPQGFLAVLCVALGLLPGLGERLVVDHVEAGGDERPGPCGDPGPLGTDRERDQVGRGVDRVAAGVDAEPAHLRDRAGASQGRQRDRVEPEPLDPSQLREHFAGADEHPEPALGEPVDRGLLRDVVDGQGDLDVPAFLRKQMD